MAQRIEANEIIDLDGIQNAFEKIKENVDGLRNGLKEAAKDILATSQALQSINGNSLNELSKKVKMLEEAFDSLNKFEAQTAANSAKVQQAQAKAATEAAKAAAIQQQAQAKIATEAAKAAAIQQKAADTHARAQQNLSKATNKAAVDISALQAEIQKLVADKTKMLSQMQLEGMTYNELQASYNAMKAALNEMTVEERNSTAAGQTMTEQARRMYEQMDALQKQTGKYTLSVGHYSQAWDALGFQMQQIMREIPSSINLNQFFLAISNNLPMLLDEVKRFNETQKALHIQADEAIAAGNQKMADEIAKQYTTLGKKIVKTVFSWQTAILGVILILRKYGEQILNFFKELIKGIEKINNVIQSRKGILDVSIEVRKNTEQLTTELFLLQKRLKDIATDTDEWRKIIARVNELTHSNLDYTTATKDEVRKVTAAYIEQQKQLAINAEVVKRMAESDRNLTYRKAILGGASAEEYNLIGTGTKFRTSIINRAGYSVEEVASLLGIAIDSEEGKTLSKLYKKARENFGMYEGEQISWSTYSKNQKRYMNFINSMLPVSSAQLDKLYSDVLYQPIVDKEEKNGRGRKERSKEIMEDLMREYTEGIQYEQLDEYTRRRIEEMYRYQMESYDLQMRKEEIEANWKETIDDSVLRGQKLAELQKQYDGIMEHNKQIHVEKMAEIQNDADNAARHALEEQTNAEIAEIQRRYEAEMNEMQLMRRVSNDVAEYYNNTIVTKRIEAMQRWRKELEALLETLSLEDEGYKAVQESLSKLDESISKESTKYATKQQTRNIKSIWEVFGSSMGFSDDFKTKTLQRMGVDTDKVMGVLGQEGIDSLFENWLKEAEQAFGTFVSKVKDGLMDLMDAYVDFYNARAEAAEKDTERAHEAYEKEKALLEAGYANSVETAWEEYQEKQAIERKAQQDAEHAALIKQQLSEVESVASLMAATADLFKAYAGGGAIGVAAAAATSAMMIGMFVAAKSKMAQAARIRGAGTVQYGEGHVEMIGGGSHASGHDSPLAFDAQGRQRRVEGGELFAVINKRAVARYGADNITDFINGINTRKFDVGGNAMPVVFGGADLGNVEGSLSKLVKQGERRIYHDSDNNTIIVDGRFKRTIRRG